MGAVKISRNNLDPNGNRIDGWGVGEKRGGRDYDPPIGWIGIGLKICGKYDNGDDRDMLKYEVIYGEHRDIRVWKFDF